MPHPVRLSSVLLLFFATCCFGQAIAYFPDHVLGDDARVEKFKVDWYSKGLTALHEPSLWEESKNHKTPIYRFLWLRSFHHPVSVRLDVQSDSTGLVTTKVTSGQGGYSPGKIIENQIRKLTREQTRWFLDLVDEVKFWDLPTNPPKESDVIGVDGAQWIVEGVRDAQYHIVDRWSPDKGEVHTLGITMLIDLAKLKLLYQEVY